MQIIQAIFNRACVIEWSTIKRVGTKDNFVAERVQTVDATMHKVTLRCARRRNHRNSGATT
jgi:hypothetical protein